MGNAIKSVWHGIKHVGEDIGHGIEHGAEWVGHEVKKGAEDVGHVASDVGHGLYDAGKFVGHVVHTGVEDVGDVAKDAAHLATKAVCYVGDGLQHVVKFIPGIGNTLANGIGGVTDLAKKGDDMFDDEVSAVQHPLDTVEDAYHAVTNPKLLEHYAKKGLNTVGQIADDGVNVATAVASLDPEGGTELADVLNAAKKVQRVVKAVKSGAKAVSDIKKGNWSKALGDAGSAIGGKVGKGLTKAAKVVKNVGKAVKVAKKVVKVVSKKKKRSSDSSIPTNAYGAPYNAYIPYDENAPNGYDSLTNYVRAKHPGQSVTAHLFDDDNNHVATMQLEPWQDQAGAPSWATGSTASESVGDTAQSAVGRYYDDTML
jgi:hypothetical protein